MAEGVEHEVPVLRIYVQSAMARTEDQEDVWPDAVFEVVRGSREPLRVATEPTVGLGLNDVIRSADDAAEEEFQIPDDLRTKLVAALGQVTTPNDPVYLLDLPAPHGYLHLVPWERLLSADLQLPLVRRPRYELVPHAKWPLRVVIVAGCSPRRTSFPVDAMVAAVVEHWRNAFRDKPLAMEVFVPAGEMDGVRRALASDNPIHDGLTQAHQVNVHQPPSPDIDITWRDWITRALDGSAVDVVHLIGHGSFRAERGVFALPDAVDKARERSIDATELCASLTRLGAWSLLLTAPVENDSPAALRDLTTAVTETRPGVVLLHQLTAATGIREQAEDSLQLLLTGQIPATVMPDVVCWHPLISAWFFRHEQSGDVPPADSSLTEPDGTSALINNVTTSVLARPNAPAWIASGARTLETLHAQLLGSATSPANPDAVEALRTVSANFNQQVREWSAQQSPEAML